MVVREFGDLSMTAPRYGTDASVKSLTPHYNPRHSPFSQASGRSPCFLLLHLIFLVRGVLVRCLSLVWLIVATYRPFVEVP
jgi:hypothetical protein